MTWACPSLALFEEAIEHGNRAQIIAGHLKSNSYIYFKSLAGIGFNYFFKGDPQKAIKIGQKLIKYGEDSGNIRSQAIGYYIMGYGQCAGGNFDKAIELSEKAIQIALDPFYAVIPNIVIGFCHLLCNRHDEAKSHINIIRSFDEKKGTELLGIPAKASLYAISIAEGNMAVGFSKLLNIQRKCLENAHKNIWVMIEQFIGKIYFEMIVGPKPDTGTLIRNIGFLIKNYPFAAKRAEEHLSIVIESAKDMGAKGILAQAYLDLGLLHKAKRQTDLAKKFISEAITIFENSESKTYAKLAKEALESLS